MRSIFSNSFLFLLSGFLLGAFSSFYLNVVLVYWFAPVVAGVFLVGFYFTLLGVLFFGLSVPSVFRRVVEGLVVFLYFAAAVAYPPILLAAFAPALFVTFFPMYLAVKHRVFTIWQLLAWIVLTSVSMVAVRLAFPLPEESLLTAGFVAATAFGLVYRVLLVWVRRVSSVGS